ncbi:MAG TPA: ABC transporter permease [Syntrophobacter fumaroxidans]|nr:ABC transporter permease [Syntrophobacter fumaroxidans]
MVGSLWSGTEHLPGIQQILEAFWELANNGVLLRYTVASLFRVTVGFYLAVLLAVPLGLLLGRQALIHQCTNPVIQFLRPISPLAWIPFAMLWFGIGDKPALFIIFIASFFPMLISTVKAAASIHPMYFQVAANLQFSVWESVYYVILPACLPGIVLALRVTLGVSWMVVVAAEMIAVKSGLGYLIIDARNALRLDYVVVAMITIGVIGLLLDYFMTKLEGMEAVRWRLEQK